MKLFKMMKEFFGGTDSEPVEELIDASEVSTEESEPVSEVSELSFASAPLPEFAVEAASSEEAEDPATPRPVVDKENSRMNLPLSCLVSSFPVELQQRVKTEMISGATISFPLDKIISQLSQGLVRVTFGEIRQSWPKAFFEGNDRDYVMVTLPLNELVSRIGTELLALRPRKQIEIPDEIVSPFGAHGEGLSIGKAANTGTPGTSFKARPRGAQSAAPVPPAADPRARGNVTSVRKPLPPGSGTSFLPKPGIKPGTSFASRTPRPSGTTPPSSGSSLPPGKQSAPKPPVGSAPIPFNFPKPAAPSGNGNGNRLADSPNVPSAPPAAPASKPEPVVATGQTVLVSLASIGAALSEPLRVEVGQLNLGEVKVALPCSQVEEGLKRGKVAFTWKQLKGWVKPAPLAGISEHDDAVVSLPLAVIAPLFFARQKAPSTPATGQKKLKVNEEIPNLFFGFPQSEAAGAAPAAPKTREIPVVPAPKPAETNYFIWDDVSDQPVAVEGEDVPAPRPQRATPGTPPGTTFASRKATPNEVVNKASMLEGVYGAMVALPDGLLVASKLDPSQNGDAIAALIPQMYSKLSGCTKELRMGELNNLNFTVGNVPWKIFRVNGIFFAAFGNAGEPLPTAHLTELAAELDYKKAQ